MQIYVRKVTFFLDDPFKQIYDAEYAFFTWPSSPVLAQYLFFNASWFRDKTILELGCGTCLPGITAAKIKCRRVVLADKFSTQESKDLVQSNLKENDISYSWLDSSHSWLDSCHFEDDKQTQVLLTKIIWGNLFDEGCPVMGFNCDSKFDCIIASDCFYDESDFESILCTVNFLLRFRCRPGAFLLTSYQERHSDWDISCLLDRWGLQRESLSLRDFLADTPTLLGSTLPGNHTIHLFKLSLFNEYDKI